MTGLRYEDIPPAVAARAKALLALHFRIASQDQGTPSGQRTVRPTREFSGTSRTCSVIRDKVQLTFEDGRDFPMRASRSPQRLSAEATGPIDMPSVDFTRWLTDNGRTHLIDAKLNELDDLIRHLEDVDDIGADVCHPTA